MTLTNQVTVLAGARIGDRALIGANSVVRGEIPADAVAVGSPARLIRITAIDPHVSNLRRQAS